MMTKVTTVIAALAMTASVLASGDGYAAPKPESYSPNWFGLLYTVIFLLCIGVVGFKNAKRTHLD